MEPIIKKDRKDNKGSHSKLAGKEKQQTPAGEWDCWGSRAGSLIPHAAAWRAGTLQRWLEAWGAGQPRVLI